MRNNNSVSYCSSVRAQFFPTLQGSVLRAIHFLHGMTVEIPRQEEEVE